MKTVEQGISLPIMQVSGRNRNLLLGISGVIIMLGIDVGTILAAYLFLIV